MTTETNVLQAQRERYNSGRDIKELVSRNREAFKAVLTSIELAEKTEAPLITINMMYSNYDDMKYGMSNSELAFRLELLERAGMISVRKGAFGTEMVSITEFGHKRYAA